MRREHEAMLLTPARLRLSERPLHRFPWQWFSPNRKLHVWRQLKDKHMISGALSVNKTAILTVWGEHLGARKAESARNVHNGTLLLNLAQFNAVVPDDPGLLSQHLLQEVFVEKERSE
jgi:hypothetical protein